MTDINETIVDTLTDSLRPIRRAALGLGSNLGDSFETLQGAVDALLETPEMAPVAVSAVYQTQPVGGPEQPEYLNAVLVVETTLSAATLLERAHAVEDAFGRERGEPDAPRTLDVDLLALGDRVLDDGEVVVPHPRLHERAFVLVPWQEVDAGFDVPGRGTVGELAAAVGTDGVRRREDLRLVVQ